MKDIQNAKETICRAYESAMVRMSDEMKSFQVRRETEVAIVFSLTCSCSGGDDEKAEYKE